MPASLSANETQLHSQAWYLHLKESFKRFQFHVDAKIAENTFQIFFGNSATSI